MATAKAKKKKVEKPVIEIVEVPDGVTLTLDQDEAQVLYDVGYYIFGGDPKTTRRKHLQAVMRELEGAGFRPSFGTAVGIDHTDMRGMSGGFVYFYPPKAKTS